MHPLNTPNMEFPLASSYNERFTTGKTSVVATGLDQRKINCLYESVENSVTNKSTLYLTKRPGALQSGYTIYSSVVSTSDTPMLAVTPPNGSYGAAPWVFVYDGTNTKAANSSAVGGSAGATITTDSGWPLYVDKTDISGAETVVLQTSTGKMFFATAVDSWTQITDTDITSVSHSGKLEHMDGFAFIAALDGYVYNSDLNSLSSWTAGNRIKKQIQQDYPLGLIKSGQILLCFGSESVEAFVNAGNATGSPLKRVPEISNYRVGLHYASEVSTLYRHYYAQVGSFTYFIGREGGAAGSASVYAFSNGRFEKVSSPFIDKYLTESGFTHICPFHFYGKQALAIAITKPDVATHQWLMFFPAHKEWFEWTSAQFQPVNSGTYFLGTKSNTARNLHHFGNSAGESGGGGFLTNQWTDGSTAFTMSTQFKLPKRGPYKKFMDWAGVVADKANGSSNLSVEFSDDDYATWSTARTIDLSTDDKRITRCGSYKDRAVRLSHSANSDCRLEAFAARVR